MFYNTRRAKWFTYMSVNTVNIQVNQTSIISTTRAATSHQSTNHAHLWPTKYTEASLGLVSPGAETDGATPISP